MTKASNSSNEFSSTRSSIRSRAVNFPFWCWASTRSCPPPRRACPRMDSRWLSFFSKDTIGTFCLSGVNGFGVHCFDHYSAFGFFHPTEGHLSVVIKRQYDILIGEAGNRIPFYIH